MPPKVSRSRNQCKATIEFGDDYGDNVCTFHCQLRKGHVGLHTETFSGQDRQWLVAWSDNSYAIVPQIGPVDQDAI